jgi:LL-diaminopimelate aminotransferase
LFPIVAKKRKEYVEAHPDAKVISLGIGDTTHPLPAAIAEGMASYAKGLGNREGYEGYDPKSEATLKAKIAEVRVCPLFMYQLSVAVHFQDMALNLIWQKMYPGLDIKADEVFVSDGSKCDIGNRKIIFLSFTVPILATLHEQDAWIFSLASTPRLLFKILLTPFMSIPVWFSVAQVRSANCSVTTQIVFDCIVNALGAGVIDAETKQYDGIVYMPCNPENDFFPDLSLAKVPFAAFNWLFETGADVYLSQDSDIIYYCNPNNPTGACANREQITALVNFAKEHGKFREIVSWRKQSVCKEI